jgi:N-glycosylase/DNA lyase
MRKKEQTEFIVETPAGFDFQRTLRSHGWYDLPPFELTGGGALARVLEVGGGEPVTVLIGAAPSGLGVSAAGRLGARALERVRRDVRHIFRLDEGLEDFYARLGGDADFAWVARDGAGRLLRSPTVYEDLVKSILTTNCSWALTKRMAAGLVEGLGREAGDGRRAFPTAEAMAAQPASFYREVVRAGYRSQYLSELAVRVASGEIDPESWLGSELPTAELKREMKRVKGVGDYAA